VIGLAVPWAHDKVRRRYPADPGAWSTAWRYLKVSRKISISIEFTLASTSLSS
jgi:hypothetical protein